MICVACELYDLPTDAGALWVPVSYSSLVQLGAVYIVGIAMSQAILTSHSVRSFCV